MRCIISKVLIKERGTKEGLCPEARSSSHCLYSKRIDESPSIYQSTYFVVTIRSEKELYESLSQSMNGLRLGAFDYSSGATN